MLKPSVNVLTEGNGAGKSNFIDLFRMLRRMMSGELTSPRATGPTSSCTKATGELVLKLRIATGAGISR